MTALKPIVAHRAQKKNLFLNEKKTEVEIEQKSRGYLLFDTFNLVKLLVNLKF